MRVGVMFVGIVDTASVSEGPSLFDLFGVNAAELEL
jgi:hypothetical protein